MVPRYNKNWYLVFGHGCDPTDSQMSPQPRLHLGCGDILGVCGVTAMPGNEVSIPSAITWAKVDPGLNGVTRPKWINDQNYWNKRATWYVFRPFFSNSVYLGPVAYSRNCLYQGLQKSPYALVYDIGDYVCFCTAYTKDACCIPNIQE